MRSPLDMLRAAKQEQHHATSNVDQWHAAWHSLAEDEPSGRGSPAASPVPRPVASAPVSPISRRQGARRAAQDHVSPGPVLELFHLRTGGSLEWTGGAAALLVGASPPHRIHAPAPAPAGVPPGLLSVFGHHTDAVYGADLPGLMGSARDRAMVRRAFGMAKDCPTGVVSLGVRTRTAHLFMVVRDDSHLCQAASTLIVEYAEFGSLYAPGRRLEPCLHSQWWQEAALGAGSMHAWQRDPFRRGYDSAEDEDSSDDSDGDSRAVSTLRNPREEEATARFLARDLLRRAGLHASGPECPPSAHAAPGSLDSSSAPASPLSSPDKQMASSKRSAKSARNPTPGAFMSAVSTALKRRSSSNDLHTSGKRSDAYSRSKNAVMSMMSKVVSPVSARERERERERERGGFIRKQCP